MGPAKSGDDAIVGRWRRAARSRLRVELAGIAFCRQLGLTPEHWARHLWSEGAVTWMGKENPTAAEYLTKEASAFNFLYPGSPYHIDNLEEDTARLTFRRGGCAGGWGQDQWGMARRLGLGKGHVCRYCREAFRLWSAQLGLGAITTPQLDGTCVFTVERPEK